MKLKHVFAITLALIIGLSALFTFAFAGKFALGNTEQDFLIYASSYPMYALSSLVLKDIPGMELHSFLQPQDAGLSAYTLSDWDTALIDNCDVLILNGGGYEGFERLLSAGDTIMVSAVSGLKYSVEDAWIIDFTGSEQDTFENPWLFMYTDGAMELTEAITANMLAVDEMYTEKYYENLGSARAYFENLAYELQALAPENRVRVAAGHEAFYYTANELGLECPVIFDRLPAQEHSDEEMSRMLKSLTDSGIDILLIESQAGEELIAYFEDNGITVIPLDLMTSYTEKDGADVFGRVLLNNAKLIREKTCK